MLKVIITPVECRFTMPPPPPGTLVRFVGPGETFIKHLCDLPQDIILSVVCPNEWSTAECERFVAAVQIANFTRVLSRNTIGQYSAVWAYNLVENAMFLTKLPKSRRFTADELGAAADTSEWAVLVGNGPGWEDVKYAPEGSTVIACLHVAPKLIAAGINIDFLIHVDHRMPYHGFAGVDQLKCKGLIATPTVHPQFLTDCKSPATDVYWFIPFDTGLNYWFEHKLGVSHPPYNGTVMNAAARCVLMSGFRKLLFMGVPLCAHKEGDIYNIKAKAVNGDTIYTTEQFLAYQEGFAQLVRDYPEAQLTRMDTKVLPIEGFKQYKGDHNNG